MKLELPRRTERVGSVRINDLQRVILLDSTDEASVEEKSVIGISNYKLRETEQKTAIIVPVKNEQLKLFEGVLSAIPKECLIIVVSNSNRDETDRFKMEHDMIEQHVRFANRNIWIIHQRDKGVGAALKKVKYGELLDKNGLIRNGKAEGMVLGMLLAKAAKKEYVGFIDADNYIPGAVHEYVKIFGAAFNLARSPYAMVRISWAYKPKIFDGSLYFSRWGRVSDVTNKYLNRLTSSNAEFETEVVKTGNSGEHAMTMKLAEILDYKSRFAVEPYEIVTILEQFGEKLATKPKFKGPIEKGVEIFQVETRNPHFHELMGDEHITDMTYDALSTIICSSLCPDSLRKEILQEYPEKRLLLKAKEKPIKNFSQVDTKKFLYYLTKNDSLLIHSESTK